MAAFSESELNTPEDRVAVDWWLMRNSAVTLFYKRTNFDFSVAWLGIANYRVHHIDCAEHGTFLQQFSDALQFQQQFGRNWNGGLPSLNFAFRQLDFSDATGIVFAFTQFDALLDRDTRTAHAVLDAAEWNSRCHLLFGHRLITLAHCNNCVTGIPKLGGAKWFWNNIDWADTRATLDGG